MIVETVLINLPKGVDRNDVMALYEKTAARWAENPDLIEKYYYFDPATGEGGGVYIWPDRAAAEKWHGADYRRMIADIYGSEPKIRIFDALMHVGPAGVRQLLSCAGAGEVTREIVYGLGFTKNAKFAE